MAKYAYRWTRFADLPDDWEPLAVGELRALGGGWAEERVRLEDAETLRIFNWLEHVVLRGIEAWRRTL